MVVCASFLSQNQTFRMVQPWKGKNEAKIFFTVEVLIVRISEFLKQTPVRSHLEDHSNKKVNM